MSTRFSPASRPGLLTLLRRIAIVAAALFATAASAELGKEAPHFSFADEVIIVRNDALVALLPIDPWGVRSILDALAVAKAQTEKPKLAPPAGKHRDVLGEGASAGRVTPPDAASNPDLNLLFQRSSPEAAYDLFQILKRVGR